MKKEDALKAFGNANRVARVLGISRQAVSAWGDDVPPLRAYQIREIMAERKEVAQ